VPSNLILIATHIKALKMNWHDREPNPKILQHSAAFFQCFDHGAAVKIKRKMSHLNIAFDRFVSKGTDCNALHFGNKRPVGLEIDSEKVKTNQYSIFC